MKKVSILLLFSFVLFDFAEQEKKDLLGDTTDPLISVVDETLNIIFPDDNYKKLKVIVCSYNNASSYIDGELVCEKNIRSILTQTYDNFEVIIINDNSTDETLACVENIIFDFGKQDICTIINNSERRGHLANQYDAIMLCDRTDVICIIDGDDWLLDDNVFTLINEAYKDQNVWLTYGSYVRIPFADWAPTCEVLPESIVQNATYRDYKWVSSHLRTFYAGLFMLIDQNDLMHEGSFWSAAADLAIMFPILEMANGNYYFIQDVIYGYNRANPLNICGGPRLAIQNECARLIRLKEHYQPVEREALFTLS